VSAPSDYDNGEIGGMIGRGNRSTRRKPAPVPLFPPQTPHAGRTRTRAAAVGSQRLAAELRHGLESIYLSIYLSVYLSISMALQPFVRPWPIFQFLDLFTQSVGLLGRGISPLQGRAACTHRQHKQNKRT
jgi:hypothetical protein